MLNKKALAATAAADKLYVEDVFSTYLYTGNGSTKTITNGIDLSGEGGLVWIKSRSYPATHSLHNTVSGMENYLRSDSTSQQVSATFNFTLLSDGFSLNNAYNQTNANNETYASWTFRQAEKFFDVVTYTGTGANNNVAHNLGSKPGCVLIKRTDTTSDWFGWHRNNGVANQAHAELSLNLSAAPIDGAIFSQNTVTSTTFNPQDIYNSAGDAKANDSGGTYVAYLFAHDAGGFGNSGNDNVISCGSFTTDGSGNATVSLGYEPQWVMYKKTNAAGSWTMIDVMRGMSFTTSEYLFANLSDAAFSGTTRITPVPNGFDIVNGIEASSSTYIYIAIRRGPMKTPEAGTEVFYPLSRTGTGGAISIAGVGFPPDMTFRKRSGTTSFGDWPLQDRLRGQSANLFTNLTGSEADYPTAQLDSFDQNGISYKDNAYNNTSSIAYINYYFRRAPGFFDEVCYTGDASTTARPHNLGVAPQLMIIKQRNDGAISWYVYAEPLGNNKYLILDSTNGQATASFWNNQTPTATNFYIRSSGWPNEVGGNYVAYLFASAPGVSKVGSYTGNGSSQTINCGFTTGARFVLIKETTNASSGSWVVFDSARGIVAGNDPYLLLNSTAAEVTDKDAVDTDSTGFVVNETTGPNLNTNSSTYIYLAIA